MFRILVVEDDDFFREAIYTVLKQKSYEVFEAANGKIAKEILLSQDFDLVITDIQMPSFSGVDLIEWANANKPTPFVMMTGFSMLLETKSAFELGAKDFLTKPFKMSDLIKVIEKHIQPELQHKLQSTKSENNYSYCKIPIEEFVSKSNLDFDIYIKLSDEKYIILARKGEELPQDRLIYYKGKGVHYLYLRQEDIKLLINFNLNVAQKLVPRSDISSDKKINFIKYTSEVLLEKVYIDGVDRKSYENAKELLTITSQIVTEMKASFDILSVMNSYSDSIYAHSVGVAMYAILIAQKMGYQSLHVSLKLSMAAIFHDIGEKEINPKILNKNRSQLTFEERKIIENHVVRSRDILLELKEVHEEVIQLIYEHHEDCAGQGYPHCKRKNEMHPLSPILQLANIFVENAFKQDKTKDLNAQKIIATIESTYLDRIDPKCLEALKAICSDSFRSTNSST